MKYSDCGVDIDKGDKVAQSISELAKQTFSKDVLTQVGGFSAQYRIPGGYHRPVLVASTDGVGTKVKVAEGVGHHKNIGIDLVAMCVNDILTCGARPLFFLDYIATGKINPKKIEFIVKGIIEGCQQAGCSLIGGETAEMPGVYVGEEYDLAGFVVGIKEEALKIDGSRIKEGNVVIGLPSNGLHSNGFSMVRKVFGYYEYCHPITNSHSTMSDNTLLGKELLKPTRIYSKEIEKLLKMRVEVRGMAHITGGGLGNINRILSNGLRCKYFYNWKVPEIFAMIKDRSKATFDEMLRTFNMGIGYLIVVSKESMKTVLDGLEGSTVVGKIEKDIK